MNASLHDVRTRIESSQVTGQLYLFAASSNRSCRNVRVGRKGIDRRVMGIANQRRHNRWLPQ